MDILKPQLVVIEGRQYRKLPVREPTNSLPAFHGITDSEDLYPDNETDPQSVEEVVPVENGYLLKMDIPSVFYKYIIGKGGAVKRDIERDTDCSIHIPRQGEVGLVEIFGRTTSNVCRAKVQLELKMEVGRGREMYTHFAGILLNAGEISENLKTFSEECLARHSKAMGVCPEVLQIPTKFHITIGMMKLFSQKEKVCSSARRLEYVFHNYNMHTYICMKHIHKHVHMLTYAHAHTHTHTHHNLY
jgi:activating signal cointegrator complex subunit 1